MTTNAVFAKPINASRTVGFAPTGGDVSAFGDVTTVKNEGPLFPQSTAPDFGFSSKDRHFDGEEEQKKSIEATVYSFNANFVEVSATISKGKLHLNIPRVLFPDEVLYDGAAILIGIDAADRFTGLSILPRVPKPIARNVAALIDDVLDWADKL
jgi:hypothetical protein